MEDQKKKTYYIEVIENLNAKIKKNESRLINAEKIGAHEPNHKNHIHYVKIKDQWKTDLDYFATYHRQLRESYAIDWVEGFKLEQKKFPS
jgi:hypothetical protein